MNKLLPILALLCFGLTQNLIENIIESYPNGFPKTIKYFKLVDNHLELDIVKEFYNTGQLATIQNWKDGKLYGNWINYYKNGQIKSKGRFNNGTLDNLGYLETPLDNREGKWVHYYENGKLLLNSFYDKNGIGIGEWNWYYDNGNLLQTDNYHDSKSNTFKRTKYNENGEKEVLILNK